MTNGKIVQIISAVVDVEFPREALPKVYDALKLAEVGKPKSNWELQGILGVAAFVLGFLAGK